MPAIGHFSALSFYTFVYVYTFSVYALVYTLLNRNDYEKMKFYLDPREGKDGKHAIVIRGRDSSGKQYRIFLTSAFPLARIEKSNWRQKQQKVLGNPTLGETLKRIRAKLEGLELTKKVMDPAYSIPDAWRDEYQKEKPAEPPNAFPQKVLAAIPFYQNYIRGKKSHGYLRILDQVEADIKGWNPDVQFSNLNYLTLEDFKSYLMGIDKRRLTEKRLSKKGKAVVLKPLESATVYGRFKFLRELANLAKRHGVVVDESIFDFNIPYTHTRGGFALTYPELLKLYYYKSENKTRMVARDYFLLEAFTGIRNSDCRDLRNGDVQDDYIQYRDQKNRDRIKSVTRHKLNEHVIKKYYRKDDPTNFLMPRLAQATINSELKFIARELKLDRHILHNGHLEPIYKHLSTHDGRHSYVTLLNMLGIPSDYVKDELGHAQGITFGTYVHRNDRFQLISEAVNSLPMEATAETRIRKLKKAV